jgi:hypothetical protein
MTARLFAMTMRTLDLANFPDDPHELKSLVRDLAEQLQRM